MASIALDAVLMREAPGWAPARGTNVGHVVAASVSMELIDS
jgi:hypothetical protein